MQGCSLHNHFFISSYLVHSLCPRVLPDREDEDGLPDEVCQAVFLFISTVSSL